MKVASPMLPVFRRFRLQGLFGLPKIPWLPPGFLKLPQKIRGATPGKRVSHVQQKNKAVLLLSSCFFLRNTCVPTYPQSRSASFGFFRVSDPWGAAPRSRAKSRSRVGGVESGPCAAPGAVRPGRPKPVAAARLAPAGRTKGVPFLGSFWVVR